MTSPTSIAWYPGRILAALAAAHVEPVVAVPAAAIEAHLVSHGQTASGGASTVIARVSMAHGLGTSSSPASTLVLSSDRCPTFAMSETTGRCRCRPWSR